eukprot:GFUD01137625.1.p1 GENE.GFUD01137625.1~~GFUD01137625.1.p1  ORF type:complete len:102 (-),score=2.12 GFUD01137625.1:40-345(-)
MSSISVSSSDSSKSRPIFIFFLGASWLSSESFCVGVFSISSLSSFSRFPDKTPPGFNHILGLEVDLPLRVILVPYLLLHIAVSLILVRIYLNCLRHGQLIA